MKLLNSKTTIIVALALIALVSCKKNEPAPVLGSTGGYSSLQNFYAQTNNPVQTFTVNAATGGSFTTTQGTIVNIPSNAFITAFSAIVTGTVTIQFKDIYKKSDMLLNQVLPLANSGTPMNSGGEFYIKALSGTTAVYLTGTTPITVTQPLQGFPLDKNMIPMLNNDTGTFTVAGWNPADSAQAALTLQTANYVFSLYNFSYPVSSGTWCNSDNSSYFSSYIQVPFVIETSDSIGGYGSTDVFLLFNGINSMVHVYQSTGTNYFPYSYAPQGLKCTVVAIEVNNKGVLKSAFIPNVTISANDTVRFTASPTTESAFKTQLATYNN